MDQTDLEWLRDYCLAAIDYQDQNTSTNAEDRERAREAYDRASDLFEGLIAEDRLQR
jgi:hypothetical protein